LTTVNNLTRVESKPQQRRFHITYTAAIEELPHNEQFRLWIPIPHDDEHQAISNIEVTKSLELEHEIRTEPVFGNTMLYIEGMTGDADRLNVKVEYDVERQSVDKSRVLSEPEGLPDGPDFDVYRNPSSLCIVNDEIRTTAAKLGTGSLTCVRARCFYDHVAENMAYDKSGTGWGLGSTAYACEAGRGNCTDFHSYFISLCLAEGIPARFQIGLFGEYERSAEAYQTGGYHCWAEFRIPGRSWVPVDISEADKGKGDFFGEQTNNRVTLSTGRDIMLAPQQAGVPLNYFLDPYVEVSGRSHTKVSKQAVWRDL